MNRKLEIFERVLTSPFDNETFVGFVREFLNNIQLVAPTKYNKEYSNFSFYVDGYYHIGNYISDDKDKIAVFSVFLKKGETVERARGMQRNFVKALIERGGCEAAVVAFFTGKDATKWRLSFIRMDYDFSKGKITEKLTPAKRYSYLVGKGEPCHTAKQRLYPIFIEDNTNPGIDDLEEAFSVEKVTNEFFNLYKDKYIELKEYLESNEEFMIEATYRNFTSEQFAKKLMGQIVFLYFIQKKGWLGVEAIPVVLTEKQYKNAFFARGTKSREIVPKVYRQQSDGIYRIVLKELQALSDEDEETLAGIVKGKPWGTGPKDFMRRIFDGCIDAGKNYFDDYLEPLFYTGLNKNRGENGFYAPLHRRIPFLNGGLFEQLDNYEWENNNFNIPNELFSNVATKGRDADGILDIFDRYNFTMNEDEPMEREVAIDPEMLGKVFENLLDVKDRKSKGAFYTPREIVHYMCQETLINHLVTKTELPEEDIRDFVLYGDLMKDEDTVKSAREGNREMLISPRIFDLSNGTNKLKELDDILANVKVADLAVGSGAFPLGMLNEIVKARETLSAYMAIGMNSFQKKSFYAYDRKPYELKVNTIKNCIFACDIEPSAVDIAKLRLWLSIVIDDEIAENNGNGEFNEHTKPRQLPNLDCNIICGNSLIDEFEDFPLITESVLLHNESENRQQNIFQSSVDGLISKLIKLQDKLFFIKDHNEKEEIKQEIQKIYDDIILEQIKGNTDVMEDYYNTQSMSSKPFILWQLYFPKVFRDNGGFDIVIGNPPYIGFQKVPNKEYHKSHFFSANGKYDFYVLFIERGLNLLNLQGIVSFICPSYFYKRNYGKNIRKLLLSKTNIKYIADFSDFQIFDSALTYTCIFGAQKGKKDDRDVKILSEKLSDSDAYYINQNNLTEPSWNLEKKENNSILEKVMSKSEYKFGNITKSISQGIVTGFNDIYYVSEDIIKKYGLETGYFVHAYKGKDIRGGKLLENGMYLFYPYEIDDKGKTVPVPEEKIKSNAPRLYKYLESNKDKLLSRGYFVKSNKKWYELWNPRKKEHFFHKKFVFAELSMFNDFALVEECFYTDSACGAELLAEYSKYYPYLLLYLNSDIATYIYKKISVPKANGYSIYKNAFLKELPIIFPDENLSKFDEMSQEEFNVYIRDMIGITEEEYCNILQTLNDYKEK